MKPYITIIVATAALFAGVAAAAPIPAPAPDRAEAHDAHSFERGELSSYRVMSSKRSHRVVQPGLVRQSGSLSLAVGNRALRTVTYASEQNFLPGKGHAFLRLVDLTTRGTARFTIDHDGSRSTFAFGNRKEHTLEVNPDDTLSYDGVRYGDSRALVTAVVASKDIPGDSLELLAGAVEIGSAELRAVDKRRKEDRQKAGRIIKIIIDILTGVSKVLD